MSLRTLARRTGGTALCASGVFGLILPLVPGLVLIIFGLYLLSLDSLWLSKHFDRYCVRYVQFAQIRDRLHRFFSHPTTRETKPKA